MTLEERRARQRQYAAVAYADPAKRRYKLEQMRDYRERDRAAFRERVQLASRAYYAANRETILFKKKLRECGVQA